MKTDPAVDQSRTSLRVQLLLCRDKVVNRQAPGHLQVVKYGREGLELSASLSVGSNCYP